MKGYQYIFIMKPRKIETIYTKYIFPMSTSGTRIRKQSRQMCEYGNCPACCACRWFAFCKAQNNIQSPHISFQPGLPAQVHVSVDSPAVRLPKDKSKAQATPKALDKPRPEPNRRNPSSRILNANIPDLVELGDGRRIDAPPPIHCFPFPLPFPSPRT